VSDGEAHPAPPSSAVERLALALLTWLLEHAPQSARGRIVAAVAATFLFTLPSAGLLALTLAVPEDEARTWFDALGYGGIFLANFLSTATVFIPVPGMLAVGHALIASGGERLSPLVAGLVGGAGMGLGETTAYMTGVIGSEAARRTRPRLPAAARPLVERTVAALDWLMERYWAPTVFVLSVVPDPIFEFAGITAGASRVPFRRFLAVVVAGNCVRGLLVAYFGADVFALL